MLEWIRKWFHLDNQRPWEPDKVECSVDDVPVECLSFELMDRGFHFNVEEDWWERTWMVATKTGCETSKEVYKKQSDHWKTMMFGNTGALFYESTIPFDQET
tara:strand:- start:8354 stop:8659 length:306 start_codon:yes stop_codon:yes gene_type:complete